MPAAFTQPRTKPNDAIGIAFSGDWTNQWSAVNRIGDRAVHYRMNACFHQGWHAGEGALEHVCDTVQVIGTQRVDEVWINAVHTPCFASLFIKSDQQAVLFLSAVVVAYRAAQKWHPVAGIFDRRNFLGQKILMLHRRDRMVNSHHRTHFVHAIAARIHDDIAIDVTFLCVDCPCIVLVLGECSYRRISVNFRTCLACPPRQCLA